MFVRRSEFRRLQVDLMVAQASIKGIELTLSVYVKQVHEVLDQNQSIIDTNKLVLDKLEEILKANNLE